MDNEFKAPEGISVGSIVGKAVNWQQYVIYVLLIVCAAQGGWILWQRGSNAKQTTEIQHLKIERDTAKTNEAATKVALDEQNKQIADAGKNYNDLQKKFDDLAKKIKNGDYYKPADNARNQPTPKSCQEALDFMNRNTQ